MTGPDSHEGVPGCRGGSGVLGSRGPGAQEFRGPGAHKFIIHSRRVISFLQALENIFGPCFKLLGLPTVLRTPTASGLPVCDEIRGVGVEGAALPATLALSDARGRPILPIVGPLQQLFSYEFASSQKGYVVFRSNNCFHTKTVNGGMFGC